MIIITALVIALVFVALAVIVNSAVYTENIGSRSSSDVGTVFAAQQEVKATVEGTLNRTNTHHSTSYDDLTRNYTRMTDAFEESYTSSYAERGAHVSVETINQTNGTYLQQTNQSRTYANASGGANDWTVADDVSGISDYNLTVVRSGLYTDTGVPHSEVLADSFSIHITDEDGDTWELHIYENTSSNVTVRPVVSGAEKSACDVNATEPRVDFASGTLDGTHCPTLVFAEGLEGQLDIEYRNPNNITGNYSLRVDTVIDAGTNTDYVDPGSGSPTATPNIYSTTTRLIYRDSEKSHNGTQRVAAGEHVYAE